LETLACRIGTVFVAATLLPLTRRQVWWVRIFDFPAHADRCGDAAGAAAALRDDRCRCAGQAFRGVLIACLALQVVNMLPYTRLARSQVQDSEKPDPENSVRLMFANVLQSIEMRRPCWRSCVGPTRRHPRAGSRRLVVRAAVRAFRDASVHGAASAGHTYGMLLFSRCA
jgi:hypothetical protein